MKPPIQFSTGLHDAIATARAAGRRSEAFILRQLVFGVAAFFLYSHVLPRKIAEIAALF